MRLTARQTNMLYPKWHGFGQQFIEQFHWKVRPLFWKAAQAMLAFQVTAQGGDNSNVSEHEVILQ